MNDCPVCLRRFGTRQQAITHLSKDAKICRTNYMAFADMLSLDVVEECERVATELRIQRKRDGVKDTVHPPTIRGPLQKQHIAAFCRRPVEDPDDPDD